MAGMGIVCGAIWRLMMTKRESGDIWLAAAIMLVVVGVLLAWFGVESLVDAVEVLGG